MGHVSGLMFWALFTVGCEIKLKPNFHDTAVEADSDTDADVDADSDADSDTDADVDADSDADADADSDADADADADADSDADADADTDSDTDADADSDADADADSDADADADADPAAGDDCGGGTFYDCALACYDESYLSWMGDGYCDDGWLSVNLDCAYFEYDGGDCSGDTGSPDGCGDGEVEDCDGVCAPDSYIGDGFCDDGSFGIGNFDCEEFDYDGGDCGTDDPPSGTCDGEDLGTAVGVGVAAGDSTGATHDWEPECTFLSGHETPDVEFWWTPPVTGPYNITTEGSDFDTVLSIVEADCSTVMACNDDGELGLTSELLEYMSVGVDYLIVIDGYSFSEYGSYVLNITGG